MQGILSVYTFTLEDKKNHQKNAAMFPMHLQTRDNRVRNTTMFYQTLQHL